MLAILQTALLSLLSAVVAAGLPIVLIAALWGVVRTLAPHDFEQVPILRRLAVIAGVLLATTLVLAGPTAISFEQGRLLAVGGAWDVSLSDFLTRRIGAIETAPDLIKTRVDNEEWARVGPALAGLILVIVASGLSFRYWRDRRALRASFAVVLAAFGMAFIGFYAAEAALWLMHKMNFWSLAILAILYQHRRHRLARRH
jgi:hypothetical protein